MATSKKRTIGRILALGMTVSITMTTAWSSAFSAAPEDMESKAESTEQMLPPFADMAGSYASEAVERLASFQLINGVEGDRFLPQKAISRQDFAVLLSKVTGVLPREQVKTRFSDVPEDSPYASYLDPLAEAGILRGRADGSLGAAEELTRQDLAVLLQRVIAASGGLSAQQQDQPVIFQDQAQIAGYAVEAVSDVTAQRWMIGSNGKFLPLAKVSRADAAVIADRILSARSEQAQKVNFSVNVKKLSLLAATSEKIELKAAGGGALPFTPVFSFDHPEIGQVLSDGTFIAGPVKGTGMITVTVGYKTLQIPVEITAIGQAGANSSRENDAAAPAVQSSTKKKPESVEQKQEPASNEHTSQSEESGNAPKQQKDELVNYAPDSFFAVKTTGPADSYFHDLEMKYPGPVGGLITPSETWTGYARQFGREVTLALPNAKTLQKVSLAFKQDKKQGILLPAEMEVELSKDGKAWFYAGKATHEISASNETPLVRTLEITLPSVDAQYVKVRFPVKVFVFARQLQVLGPEEQQVSGAPVLFAPLRKAKSLEDEKAGKRMENMLLAYSGGYAERGSWTKNDFLPLVGYMTTDGKVLDQMFDSILFLPYPNLASTKGGWDYYLNDLFRPGRQLDALNEAMMEYNKRRGTLHISPTVENVVLTLPYPDPNQASFGKILENQDSLSFQAKAIGEERAYNYRKEALEWYFAELKKRWDKAEYRYLKLDGIYWYHELIDDGVPRERQLIREMASLVHDQSLRYYWIPYFGATGLAEWRELGFDYAFVQPNFYSDKPIPVDRIEATLAVANKYGMGIEVEGDERMVRDMRYYQLYYNQLIAAHKLGIDKDKIHAYYYGSKSLLEAVHSKDANGRAVYDDTYQWMRGRFTKQEYLLPPVTQTVDGKPVQSGQAGQPLQPGQTSQPSVPGQPPQSDQPGQQGK